VNKLGFTSEEGNTFSSPNFTTSQYKDHLVLCLLKQDLSSCSFFYHLCTLSLFKPESSPCELSTKIVSKLSNESAKPPKLVYDYSFFLETVDDFDIEVELNLFVKEFNIFGVPLGTQDLNQHLTFCGKKIKTKFSIGYNQAYNCQLIFGESASSPNLKDSFSLLFESTKFYSIFISDSKKETFKRIPIIMNSADSNLDIFNSLFNPNKINEQSLHSHYFLAHPFQDQKGNRVIRHVSSFDIIVPAVGLGSFELKTPVLVLTYQDVPVAPGPSFSYLDIFYSLNFVTEKTKFRTVFLCLFCIGNVLMVLLAIASTVCFSKKMSQIQEYSNNETGLESEEPSPPEVTSMFSKYYEIPFKFAGKQKTKFFIKKTFRYMIVYNSVVYFGFWLVCFVLLKLQTRNKLTILSSRVFAEEYLLEKITSLFFYTILLVYILLEIQEQASRKIFFIDWESPNLPKIRETRIKPENKVILSESQSKTIPTKESKPNIEPFNYMTKESSDQNSKQINGDSLLMDSFDEDQSYLELVQSEEELRPEPVVKKNFQEDLIQVHDKEHPINLMNMVYQNYLNHQSQTLSSLNTQSHNDFSLFRSKSEESSHEHSRVHPNQLTKTSAWRKIMITNSFNEVSSQIKISPLIILCISYCLLEGIGTLDLGHLTRQGQSSGDFSESHYFLRKYWIFGVVLLVSVVYWVLRWMLKFVDGFACSELLDLCSVCNISLLVQLESGSFCYVHGKNHSGSGEGDLQTIYSKLVLEGAEFQATRGLNSKSDQQVFEVLPGSSLLENVQRVQTQANKYFQFLQNSSLNLPAQSTFLQKELKSMDLKLYELLNKEVERVLKESINSKNFTCKVKTLTEKLFFFEGLELLISLTRKAQNEPMFPKSTFSNIVNKRKGRGRPPERKRTRIS
jgi:hypothetical protein